jgi:hypothetical protein
MTCTNDGFEYNPPLTGREAYQVLKDIALGTRIMTRASGQSWREVYHWLMPVEIDGWRITLFNCEERRSPDGRVGLYETCQRKGTDPVELLSGWEQGQLKRLLNNLGCKRPPKSPCMAQADIH